MGSNKIAPPTDEQYQARRLEIVLSYAPRIYACAKCKWPVIDGYCCNTCGDKNPRYSAPQSERAENDDA
jgi:hypothetical protein